MKKFFALVLAVCMLIPIVSLGESAVFGKGKIYIREKGGTLHLRSEATTKSESLGIVHQDDEIDVLFLGDEWSYIFSYRVGMNGYIKTKYIVDFVPDENMFTEIDIQTASDSAETYPMPGRYHLDLDGDGAIDTVNASLFYDEYGNECFTIIFETAYGSSGEATIPYSSYDARIAFAKLDETNRVYIFVTYAFYVDQGHMKNVDFVSPAPLGSGLGMAGRLDAIEQGHIVIVPILDVLGTRFYKVNMVMENGVVVPYENAVYTAVYDLVDDETWEYASLKAISSIPCFINGNETMLDPGAKVIITWLNANEKEIGFTTESGLNGYFKYSEAMDHYYGVYVGGVFEEDAFESIPYAG